MRPVRLFAAAVLVVCGPSLTGAAVGAFELDPALFLVDTAPAPVSLRDGLPALAAASDRFLLVFARGTFGSYGLEDIHAVVLDSLGNPQQEAGFPVCAATGTQSAPSAAFSDTLCLVTWHDSRSGGQFDIFAARVTMSGRVLDVGGFAACSFTGDQTDPVVAGSDSVWLVVWVDGRGSTKDIRAARVGHSGVLLDPGSISIGHGQGNQTAPAVACHGDTFLVVWQSDEYGFSVVRGARVTAAGVVLDPGGFIIAGDVTQDLEAREPTVAASAVNFLVAWQNPRGAQLVQARLVGRDGTLLCEPFVLRSGASREERPAAACNGTSYVVAWQDFRAYERNIHKARLSLTGAVLDTQHLLVAGPGVQSMPGVCATATRYLTAWQDEACTIYESPVVHGALLDSGGRVLSPNKRFSPYSRAYGNEDRVAASGSDSGYLLVWQNLNPHTGYACRDVHGLQLDAAGSPLAATSTELARTNCHLVTPAVSAGATSHAIVYVPESGYPEGVWFYRASLAGRPLDDYPQLLSTTGADPAVQYAGDTCLAVWLRTGTGTRGIYGARVTSSGTILDPGGRQFVSSGADPGHATAVSDGVDWFVLWHEDRHVRGVRISADGSVRPPGAFTVGPYGSRDPGAVFDGEKYVVVWSDYYSDYVYATRVLRNGQVIDTNGVRVSWGPWPSAARLPEVEFDGEHYVVVWASDWSRGDLRGSVVDGELAVADTFLVTPPGDGVEGPALVRGPGGRILLLCSGRGVRLGGCDTLTRVWGAFVDLPTGLQERGLVSAGAQVRPAVFRSKARFIGLEPGSVVVVRDVSGRSLRQVAVGPDGAVAWDGRDVRGCRTGAGVYVASYRVAGRARASRLVKLE